MNNLQSQLLSYIIFLLHCPSIVFEKTGKSWWTRGGACPFQTITLLPENAGKCRHVTEFRTQTKIVKKLLPSLMRHIWVHQTASLPIQWASVEHGPNSLHTWKQTGVVLVNEYASCGPCL